MTDHASTVALSVAALVVAALTLVSSQVFGEVQALGALLYLFILAVALQKYRYGILLATFLLPLSAARVAPREILGMTGLNPFNVALATTALLILLTRVMRPHRIALPSPPTCLLLYLAAMSLATLNGAAHVGAIPAYFSALHVISFDSIGGYVGDVLIKPLLILAAAFLLAVGIRNARHTGIFLVPIFCAAIVLPLTVIADVMLAPPGARAIAGGGESFSGMHVNELGLMFNMAFSLALFCFFSRQRIAGRWLLGIVLLALVIATGLTFSRGAYLGFLTVVGCFLYRKRRFDFMVIGLLLVPLAVLFMPEAVVQRAATGLGNGDLDAISAGRVNDIWRPLLPSIAASPVAGQGLSSVLWSEPAKTNNFFTAGRIGHPHSAYLGMLLDFGLLGALVVVAFFVHMWRTFTALARELPQPLWRDFFAGAAGCVLVLMIQGVTDDRVTPTVAQSFLWLGYGAALGFVSRQRSAVADNGMRMVG